MVAQPGHETHQGMDVFAMITAMLKMFVWNLPDKRSVEKFTKGEDHANV
jgi:hypothetical protein